MVNPQLSRPQQLDLFFYEGPYAKVIDKEGKSGIPYLNILRLCPFAFLYAQIGEVCLKLLSRCNGI
jgi:hypothetical protein